MMVKPNITMNDVVATIVEFGFEVEKINISGWYFTENEWQDESGFDIMVHVYGKNGEHKYFTYAEMIKNFSDAYYIASELKEYLDYIYKEVDLIFPINI